MNYPIPWLECRYPFDSSGRNKTLEKEFLRHFSDRDSLTILDLGAGNGSNIKYWQPNLGSNQHWILAELESELADSLRELPYKEVRILEGDIEESIRDIDFGNIDVVMANALFDLFPYEKFNTLIKTMTWSNVTLFFTLNYRDMSFFPAHEFDPKLKGFYHAHMQREQNFGRAMGAEGPMQIESTLLNIEGKLFTGDSIWKVGNKDLNMLAYLLDFMEAAIGELQLEDDDRIIVEEWLAHRRSQRVAKVLSIDVFHTDFLLIS